MPNLEHLLNHVAIVGACGKMGRGIALLILQEITLLALENKKVSHLKLIDVNEECFEEVKLYLKEFLTTFAERNINRIRELYSKDLDIVSNEEAILAFVQKGLNLVDCSTSLEHAKGSSLIFEAAFEEVDLKIKILKEIAKHCPKCYVLSNTSSIPVALLAEKSGLNENLIGFHFYNPPPVQKLLEIISSKYTDNKLELLAIDLTKRLHKIPIFSADVTGFIGNGHFFREILFACDLVKELEDEMSIEEAITFVDLVTRDYLLRPMGIFQLLDYVGIPIVHHVKQIMKTYLPEPNFDSPLIGKFVSHHLQGGQNYNGEQRKGIFSYEKGKPIAVYSLSQKNYVPITQKSNVDISWKTLQKEKMPEVAIRKHFEKLYQAQDRESKLAIRFLEKSADIVEKLVEQKIARSNEDVGTILKKGFYHLYNPVDIVSTFSLRK